MLVKPFVEIPAIKLINLLTGKQTAQSDTEAGDGRTHSCTLTQRSLLNNIEVSL